MPTTLPHRLLSPLAGALLAVAVLLPAGAAEPAPAPEPAAAEKSAARTAPRRDTDPAERMWWNGEKLVAGLGLSPEQRSAMDARLTTRLAERRDHLVAYGKLRGEMATALAAGDWEAAEAKAAEASTVLAAANGAETDLVIDVMKLLSPTQRRRMGEEKPQLLRRPWLVGGINRSMRRGGSAAGRRGN